MTKQDIINLKPHSLMELNMMEWKKLMDVIKTAHSLRAQAATADFNSFPVGSCDFIQLRFQVGADFGRIFNQLFGDNDFNAGQGGY